MPQPLPPLPADIGPINLYAPYAGDDDRDAVRDWAAHVAAGRTGTPAVTTPALTPPDAAADRDRATALFAGHARDARRLRRERSL